MIVKGQFFLSRLTALPATGTHYFKTQYMNETLPDSQTPLEKAGIVSPMRYIPAFLKNKFFVAFSAFAVIMLFLDKNDVLTGMARSKELKELQESKAYYTHQIAAQRQQLEALKTNPATLEKFARENYLMKKDNEDLFIVPENYDTPNN